jgi:hypothetical protein
MEPNFFFIYPKKGIAHVLNNFGHKKYPSSSLDKNDSIHGVYGIPSWGYCFSFRFELLIFGAKKGFLVECKIKINFLIISSNTHIIICEDVFLTINRR